MFLVWGFFRVLRHSRISGAYDAEGLSGDP